MCSAGNSNILSVGFFKYLWKARKSMISKYSMFLLIGSIPFHFLCQNKYTKASNAEHAKRLK